MDRRFFMRALAGAGMAGALGTPAGFGANGRKPNFVFILADDLGWTDLGCFGSSFYETPNLDRLRAEGMKFTRAYAACPVCSPTRASILTGRYPARVNITDWIPGRRDQKRALLEPDDLDQLPLEETTLAEHLGERGYATFFAGKWHLGAEGFYPEDQGFDINKGGHERGGPYGGDKYFSPYGNPRLEDGPPGEHLPDRLASETVNFMEANQDGPFLAYLSFYSVHTPLMTRDDLREKYERKAAAMGDPGEIWGKEGNNKLRLVQNHAVYAGMVEAMDRAAGKVLDALDRLGLADNTVVFFMSDNGGLSTSEGHPTSNLPLRGGKGWMYEGGIREPVIVRAPGVTKPGSVCHSPVTSTDFFPTMLELAGLPPRPDLHMDGKSFAPLLRGGRMDRGPIFWHYPHYSNQGGTPTGAVMDDGWKLIEFYETGDVELYRIGKDIGERHNLAPAMPETAERLRSTLAEWRESIGAKMPIPNPDFKG